MTDTERQQLKEKIIAAIAEMEEKIKNRAASIQPISPENAIGRVSRMDAINNKGVADAAMRQAERKLVSLRVALSKIDSPTFGNCNRCKNPIQPARLMYMPESAMCVRCAGR
jgi:DnaK suppressor protein